MLTKYLSDVALVRIGADQWWSPIDYMRSVSTLQASTLSGAASWLMPALTVWTLPFLWAGITLTLLGALLILFGQEGAICIAMAIPLAFVVALMGGEFGRQIAAETGGDLRPAALGMLTGGYWQMYGDYLIHRIHVRVLEHIRTESERARPLVSARVTIAR